MFRPTKKETQIDMFSNVADMLRGPANGQFNDRDAWHNVFFEQVIKRVDEDLFKELFSQKMGAPNAPIKTLLGMMALKEAFGWSDSELFEQCRFNLLVRKALGLYHINDAIPAESTYYLFRKRVHGFQNETGVDLIEKVFQEITSGQVRDFNVSGRSIRMDSKLIGSNIAWSSRYELVHDTLALFFKSMDKKGRGKLSSEEITELTSISASSANHVVYRSNRVEVQQQLVRLGILSYKLLSLFGESDNKHYKTLRRVFEDQFTLDQNGQASPVPSSCISPDSVQSPYDTDCAYRNKDGKKVKGYSVNVTETCDQDGLNLVTDVQVGKANKADVDFVESAIDRNAKVTGHFPENLHADGAYQSPGNVGYCQENNIDHYFTGMQGPIGRYNLEQENGQLMVTDTQTGEIINARKCKSGKWGIKTEKGYRYFSQREIETYRLRKQIEAMPPDKRSKRNNVEATIFQLCFHSRNNKTRYRGWAQNKTWALLRCIWINLRRIMGWTEQICQRTACFGQALSKKMFFTLKTGQKLNFFLQISWNQTFYKNLNELYFFNAPAKKYFL